MEQLDIRTYLDIALRRKYWIVITFLITLLAGLSYVLVVPKIFEAQTLILVQPQKVPEDFVRSVISSDIDFRLMTITRQLTSRTNLEKIIKEYRLYNEPGNSMLMEDKVGLMQGMIKIEMGEEEGRGRRDTETSTFTIAFRGENPRKVAAVTNALASNFITENLKIRESQAIGTSTFLGDELESMKKNLMDKEAKLKQYRERHMGGLPEQLHTNLRVLERLQSQLDQYNDNLRDAENRKILVQTQIADSRRDLSMLSALPGQPGKVQDLFSLKLQLASLEARYTGNHPDVIRLRETIAGIEAEQSDQSPSNGLGNDNLETLGVNPALVLQFQNIDLAIKSLKADIKEARTQMKQYQKKVEDTPKREQELLTLNRDYENVKELYKSLLNRKLEAEIAVSMERKQKGEQFRIVDSARIPIRPVKPNIPAIVMLTFILGMGLGVGSAYLREAMDTSYKTPEEMEKELKVPVLVSMPFRYTKGELRIQKLKGIMKAASVGLGFALCGVGIVFATKGVDRTLNFIQNLFSTLGS